MRLRSAHRHISQKSQRSLTTVPVLALVPFVMFFVPGLNVNHVVAAALCSVLALGSPVPGPEPIRCAPCTPEKLSQCPAVAPGCAEVLREPGCGCCPACALRAGELCGIYTAPCGSGLRCTPRPGDPRPLHALTRGHAVCTESAETEATPESQTPGKRPSVPHAPTRCIGNLRCSANVSSPLLPDAPEPEAEMDNTAVAPDAGTYLPGSRSAFDPRGAADAQESMKAKLVTIRKKLVEQVRTGSIESTQQDFA